MSLFIWGAEIISTKFTRDCPQLLQQPQTNQKESLAGFSPIWTPRLKPMKRSKHRHRMETPRVWLIYFGNGWLVLKRKLNWPFVYFISGCFGEKFTVKCVNPSVFEGCVCAVLLCFKILVSLHMWHESYLIRNGLQAAVVTDIKAII